MHIFVNSCKCPFSKKAKLISQSPLFKLLSTHLLLVSTSWVGIDCAETNLKVMANFDLEDLL